MTKLSDIQLILLTTASQRDNGSLIPLPETLGDAAERVRRAIQALIKRGFAEEGEVTVPALSWRQKGDLHFGVRITNAGKSAINVGDETVERPRPNNAQPAETPSSPKTSKTDQVVSLLSRDEGALLSELIAATGWLPHTTRAALTGLRKKGYVIDKGKRDDTTCYRISAKA